METTFSDSSQLLPVESVVPLTVTYFLANSSFWLEETSVLSALNSFSLFRVFFAGGNYYEIWRKSDFKEEPQSC